MQISVRIPYIVIRRYPPGRSNIRASRRPQRLDNIVRKDGLKKSLIFYKEAVVSIWYLVISKKNLRSQESEVRSQKEIRSKSNGKNKSNSKNQNLILPSIRTACLPQRMPGGCAHPMVHKTLEIKAITARQISRALMNN